MMTQTPVDTSTARPASTAEVADVLREGHGPVLVRGAATQLDWAGRVDEPATVIDTTALRGMLTYEPADMTASMRAGTPLSEVQDHLRPDGQWVALDPPSEHAGATIGGLLAAGDAGPSRLGYGSLRDHVIGLTLVLADGTIAHSGGHVIKNVAGYDLAKLAHGALGTLVVVTEVVVRLHPRPSSSITATVPANAAQATAAAHALMASTAELDAVEWIGHGTTQGRLLMRLDGTPASTHAALDAVQRIVVELGFPAEHLEVLDEPEARHVWAEHAQAVRGAEGETVFRVAGLAGDLPHLIDDLGDTVSHRVVSGAAQGLHTFALTSGSPDEQAIAFTRVRERALTRGSSVLLRRRPAALDALVDPLGPPPSTVALLRRIAAELDPAGRLGPGRFRPWF